MTKLKCYSTKKYKKVLLSDGSVTFSKFFGYKKLYRFENSVMENNKNLLMVGITLFILASCGSSGADVDAVAEEMMTGKDPLSEKMQNVWQKILKRTQAMINGV